MSMLDLFIGDRDLDTEPIGDPIIEIQRIHLSDGSNLPMVTQNKLPVIQIDRRDNPVGSAEQRSLRCVVIEARLR